MSETNDLDNNHEDTYLNLLIEECLEPLEGTQEPKTAQSSRQREVARYFVRKSHSSARAGPKYSSNSW